MAISQLFYQVIICRGFTLYKTLTIEVLSSLQIIYLVLQIMINSMASHETTFIQQYKGISLLTSFLNLHDSSYYGDPLLFIWILCGIYLALHVIILVSTLLYLRRRQCVGKKHLERMHIGYILHSRILFFIIQIFLFSFIESASQISSGESFTVRTIWIVFTILLLIINLGLALLKEFMLYQTMKEKNTYAGKNNYYHQITLIYKTIALLPTFYGNSEGVCLKLNSVLHMLFTIALLYVLFKTLPFYEFLTLKTAMIMTTIILSGSLVSVLTVFITDINFQRSMHFFAPILPVFMVKIVLSRFELLLSKILRGEFTTPEYAIHYALLLKEIAYLDHTSLRTDKKMFFGFSILNTGVKAQTIGFVNLNYDSKLQADYKPMLDQVIMRKFELILQMHPKSSLILLSMAQLHLKRLDNNFKAIELINRIQNSTLSFSTKASIEHIRSQINEKHAYSSFDSDTRLLVQDYFRHSKVTNNIKSDILKEVRKHIELWNEFKASRTDMKKVTMDAEIIDQLYLKIQASLRRHDEDLRFSFPLLTLMKAVYLNSVRTQPTQGEKIFSNFKILQNNLDRKNILDIHTDDIGIVTISLERYKPSKIIYASGSIENMFSYNKADLVGSKFESLFPSIIAKNYQNILQQYVKSPDQKLDYKTETVGVTANGHLFELEVQLCLYTLANEHISVIALLKKKSEFLSVLLANHDGDIVSVSKRLKNRLIEQRLNIQPVTSIQGISRELVTINQAFNLIHKSDCTRQESPDFDIKEARTGRLSIARSGRKDITSDHLITNNSILISTNREKDVSRIFRDPYNLDQSLKSQRITTTLSKLHSVVEDYDKPKRLDHYLTISEAQQIYEEFRSGAETTLTFESTEHNKKKVNIQANISFKALLIDGSVYKIINILDMKERRFNPQINLNHITFNHENETVSQETFADNFPSIEEKYTTQIVINPPSSSSEISDNTEQLEIQTLGHGRVEIIERKLSYSLHTLENRMSHAYNRELFEKQTQVRGNINQQDPQRSSVKSAKNQEIKTLKMLEKISEKRIVQPKIRSCLLILYLLILLMVVLSSINFYLSQKSIQNVKNSIEIANIATQRLQETVRMLQYSLLLFSSGTQTVTYPASLVYIWHYYFAYEMENFVQSNYKLKKKFSITEETSLIEEVFAKTIMFNSPLNNMPNYYGELDTFTAADILLTKYRKINSYSNDSEILKIEDIFLTLNLTSNSFLLSSQHIITSAEDFVDVVTSRSLTAFNIIHVFQNILLLLIYVSVLSIPYIILQPYKRLFRSLTKLNERRINSRISQLMKVKALLEGDIDSKHFVNCSANMLGNTKSMHESRPDSKSSIRSKFVTKNALIYLIRIIVPPLLLSAFFGTLFGLTSLKLIKSFSLFKKTNKQVSVLNEVSYQANMLVCAFSYRSLFPTSMNMLIYGLPADEQILNTFSEFKDINENLRTMFLDDKDTDEFVKGALTTTICQYVIADLVPYCASVYRDGKNGLIFANEAYLGVMSDLYNIILQNSNQSQLSDIYSSYTVQITPMISILQSGYPIVVDHILDSFNSLVETVLKQELGLFVAIVVYAFVYVLIMHLVVFRKLRTVDLLRGKIIKIVPYYMVEECRIMSLHLKKEFPKEAEETGAFR